MYELRTIVIDDPVAMAFLSLSHKRLFSLIHQMAPLRRGHYVVTCLNLTAILVDYNAVYGHCSLTV